MSPRLSVCIPAYNRPELLPPLLDSVLSQDYNDYEIVICEDKSPARPGISAVVSGYQAQYPNRIRYFENEINLGYDANLRNLLNKAEGDYCVFMGNDDLMCPGALAAIAGALSRYDNVGVLLRSYAAFDGTPDNITQTFRYFDSERFFPAGTDTICTFFRRSVVIPGMTLHRKEALKHATDKFDGTLLYQLHLVGRILTAMNGVFLPQVIALYRTGGIPDFGNSEKEKGRFVPTQQTPESSLHFIKGMLDIAQDIETSRRIVVYDRILRDLGNYSYPLLSIQSRQSLTVFMRYAGRLARMGFWKNIMFHAYFLLLLFLGAQRADKLIAVIKKRLGHTPAIGDVYQGQKA